MALCLTATFGMAQTNYEVRWANNPEDAKHYDTQRLRKEFAIEKVFALLNIRISKEASLSELKESFFDEIQSRAKKHSLATDFESISK